MMALPPWGKTLDELLAGPKVDAATRIETKRILRFAVRCRMNPAMALRVIFGIVTPPHQRLMLYNAHRGAITNVFVGSRGTSKSAVIACLYAVYKALYYPKRKGVTLSAAGFRGGQLLYSDIDKVIRGGWDSQTSGLNFVGKSIATDKILHRAQNFWSASFTSLSELHTFPTNDPEKLRGIRGHDLWNDEVNFMDWDLVSRVSDSFLNVLGNFAEGGENAMANSIFYTSTIDYGWRDFQRTVQIARETQQREYDGLQAIRKGERSTFDALEKKGMHTATYVCFDYTDTIIRRFIDTDEGERFEVIWPDKKRKWKRDPNGIPFTTRGSDGRVKLESPAVELITTYPINRKGMESKVRLGETPQPIWLSEQRNVVDSSAGDVYPHHVVDRAVCKGARYITHWEDCGDTYQAANPDTEKHFVPPVMWSCSDPCVLGVDYAPGQRDFTAFVVIRLGPLAKEEFNPLTGLGQTPWSNVIWCEQHRSTSHADVATKIHELRERYNLIWHYDPVETDTWKLCRAIGLDMRGGGSGVRDELVHMNLAELGEGQVRIFDPLDSDDRVKAFSQQGQSEKNLAMLDAIYPTDQLNDKLVEFTVGQMQQGFLYLPKNIPESERPYDHKLDLGYNGAAILEYQLRALQQAPTKNYRTFFMKGDQDAATSHAKKDMWAAFIYAGKQARAHILRHRQDQDTPPPMGARVALPGRGLGPLGRVPGAKGF